MVQIPTDEQVGMIILKIFGEFNIRSGEILHLGSINSKIESHGCRADDVNRGL